MKMESKKLQQKKWIPVFFALLAALFLFGAPAKVQAAKAGFYTTNGKTYYLKADGTRQTGYLKLNGKTYYFDPNTTYMLKGWQYNTKKEPVRYFDSKTGVMYTGYFKNSAGQYRYFSPTTGLMAKGWARNSKNQYRYFNPKSGYMVTGWVVSGQYARYFNASTGYMVTGWVKNSTGIRFFRKDNGFMLTGWFQIGTRYRYFEDTKPSNGIGTFGAMYTGLKKIGGYYYYFKPATTLADVAAGGGINVNSGLYTIGGNTYYFLSNGRARIGWQKINNNLYFFNAQGVMYKNTTATISGKTYQFSSTGVATLVQYPVDSSTGLIKVVNSGGKSLKLYSSFLQIPGIADGSVDDVTLLAAIADREMGYFGEAGMMGVCMCILNRTLPENSAFPDKVAECIFQSPQQFSESSSGSFAAFEKRILGQGTSAWANETAAKTAAKKALAIFNNYKAKKTPRKISGFTTSDFDYVGFMTPSAMISAIASGANPGKTETFKGVCIFFDCWNKAWGNK